MTDSDTFEMPMFPLGSVLFPDGVLPLHIFEIRYQQLLNHVLEGDRRFGVVLISRGSEVGGGDLRNDIGTIAHIDEHHRFDDGRAAVVSSGVGRLQVVEWLDDAPYPRALVRELAPEPVGEHDSALVALARSSFDELVAVGRRLGRIESVPEAEWIMDLSSASGLDAASWQLANRAPCSALDRYSVLAAATRQARLERIDELLREVRTDLELMGELGDTP